MTYSQADMWSMKLTKKVKGRHLYTATYMNMTSSGLQCKVAYRPAMTLGGTSQLAAAQEDKEDCSSNEVLRRRHTV